MVGILLLLVISTAYALVPVGKIRRQCRQADGLLGVETEEQLSIVRALECDEAQGYLYSRPLPTRAFEKLLREAGFAAK